MDSNDYAPPPGPPPSSEQKAPPLPARHEQAAPPPYDPQDYANQPTGSATKFETPPHRMTADHDDISSPVHFTRDPHILIGYLVPFPKPNLHNIPPDRVPTRFLIYTPPPPPLTKPGEGEKEAKLHKLQRKWQDELREARTSNAKTASWKGIKGKVTKGINWGMSQTKPSSLDFLNRINLTSADPNPSTPDDAHADDGHDEGHETTRTVKLEEMRLLYPTTLEPSDPAALRREFVDTMLRSKSKAQRDAIIATGLLPVSLAIDVLATLVWPFGGLLEIDSVWLYASFRGAKTSRNVTKRLTSTATSAESMEKDSLQLNLLPTPRLAVLERYLAAQCHAKDPQIYPAAGPAPTESEVLEAIGWFPSSEGGVSGGGDGEPQKNWEDEQWEISEVKEDLRNVMQKGAKEWDKWCKLFEKHPEKATKK